MLKSLTQPFTKFRMLLKEFMQENKQSVQYKCRVLNIEADKNDEYIAIIQIVNKNQQIKMKPEDILADDELTNCFSQCDVRTLTYLGYLGINSPKYKILAKRLSAQDGKLIFALKERGKQKPIVKTADEISSNKDIIQGLKQEDAHMVGYVSADEKELIEKEQRAKLIESLKNEK